MFSITQHKGFQVTVNGYILSVQFGPGNYCGNRHMSYSELKSGNACKCETAEIALWANDEKQAFVPLLNNNDVAGWIKADKVAAILGGLVALVDPTDETVGEMVRGILRED